MQRTNLPSKAIDETSQAVPQNRKPISVKEKNLRVVFAVHPRHPIVITHAYRVLFNHIDRIAHQVITGELPIVIVVGLYPEKLPTYFSSLSMQQHSMRADINTESCTPNAHAKVGVHVIHEEVFVKWTGFLKNPKRDQASRRDRLLKLDGLSFVFQWSEK